MGGSVLALDTILSASFHFVKRWNPELSRSASRDLLRFVIIRLYDEGRGQLVNTQLTLAQTTLARKLGISRQWVGVLLDRLQAAGWIEYDAPWIGPGMRGSTSYRIGRMLKRLLVMLTKSKRGKKAIKPAAKSSWQFSPSKLVMKMKLIEESENQPLDQRVLEKIPLLKTWLSRG